MIGPSPIDEVIKNSLKSMNEKVYIKYLRESIFYDWEKIIGEANAKKIKPLRIVYKKLYLYAKDSAWRAHVYAYKPLFIKKINDYLGENLIDEILFGNPLEKPKEEEEIINAPKTKAKFSKEVIKINLSEEELAEIEKNCACIEDETLRHTLLKASINRAKLEKYRIKNNWHECPNCGNLCPPDEKICNVCERLENDIFERAVMKLLKEVPWLTYAEIKREIKKTMPQMLNRCTPDKIENIRGMLVLELCRSLDKSNQNQVNSLVMLFKGVKSEDLTPQLISKTLYELRNDTLK